MLVFPGPTEARLRVNNRLVAAQNACHALIDELDWLSSHFRDPLPEESRHTLHERLREINGEIETLWEMTDDEIRSLYKHIVGQTVRD